LPNSSKSILKSAYLLIQVKLYSFRCIIWMRVPIRYFLWPKPWKVAYWYSTLLSVAKALEKAPDEKPTNTTGIHLVAAKQSLLTVANLYKVTMAELRKWNNLTSDVLKEGQRLQISAPASVDKSTLLPVKTSEPVKTEADISNNDGLRKTIETGIAELIDVPDNSGKYLALHKSAPIGTLVLVKNLANNQSIWVKVIGRLPSTDSKLIIKLSPKAFERLNAIDKRIRAEISYLVQ
jgi:LysM repeat protein